MSFSHSVAQRFNNKKRLVKVSWEKTRDEDEVLSSRPQAQAKLLDLFGRAVLSDKLLREMLPEHTYKKLIAVREAEREMDSDVAEQVAAAMKEWATRQGATHYTHWFQPMNGYTAEKHDSFISLNKNGGIDLKFGGFNLVKGEPDASSFPSGGIRSTFEARGYTAWDMNTPAFLRKGISKGQSEYTTLCIPTAFSSYTGDALDSKTPLIRSEEVLSKAAIRLLHILGETDVKRVYSTLGAEQEFFLVDRGFYLLRPDLIATGRTLIGSRPPKGQELEEHYFGKMPRRVQACLEEVDQELWELGVPSMTRHNEVAPSQYEMAPIFEKSTLACDHNMLTMEILRDVAKKHGLVCLLHEKPFSFINGSGKHNNWSMSTNTGKNLLNPGVTPEQNLTFLTFLTAVLRAVHLHGDLLRAVVTVPGNDYRLGANEAPPAIISVFLGSHLNAVCEAIIQGKPEVGTPQGMKRKVSTIMELHSIAKIPRDTTDRNRTSPFAFTGNKFEFRAVGSSQTCATPVTTINTIIADSLIYLADLIEKRLKEAGFTTDRAVNISTAEEDEREDIINAVICDTLKEHYDVVFNGNNYSEEWTEIAKERGLPNLRTAPEALAVYTAKKNIDMFARLGVLSETEQHARSNITNEFFLKSLVIEGQSMVQLAENYVLPAAIQYQKNVAESIVVAAQVLDKEAAAGLLAPQKQLVAKVTGLISDLMRTTQALKSVLDKEKNEDEEDPQRMLHVYHPAISSGMKDVRAVCDALEETIDDALWPLPKYSEMLFLV